MSFQEAIWRRLLGIAGLGQQGQFLSFQLLLAEQATRGGIPLHLVEIDQSFPEMFRRIRGGRITVHGFNAGIILGSSPRG
jgi:hypothetical protein